MPGLINTEHENAANETTQKSSLCPMCTKRYAAIQPIHNPCTDWQAIAGCPGSIGYKASAVSGYISLNVSTWPVAVLVVKHGHACKCMRVGLGGVKSVKCQQHHPKQKQMFWPKRIAAAFYLHAISGKHMEVWNPNVEPVNSARVSTHVYESGFAPTTSQIELFNWACRDTPIFKKWSSLWTHASA